MENAASFSSGYFRMKLTTTVITISTGTPFKVVGS
jgi:hypothetical protein